MDKGLESVPCSFSVSLGHGRRHPAWGGVREEGAAPPRRLYTIAYLLDRGSPTCWRGAMIAYLELTFAVGAQKLTLAYGLITALLCITGLVCLPHVAIFTCESCKIDRFAISIIYSIVCSYVALA